MQMFRNLFFGVLVVAFVALVAFVAVVKNRSTHDRFGWKAEDYFDDPQVIELCRAIEANDLKEIDRLIAAGADVNAKGKGNMTPLLWAYPDNKPEVLKRLLRAGADPNVVVESNFNTQPRGAVPGNIQGSQIMPGESVTHMACQTAFPKYFNLVFDNGGDPNLRNPETHEYPLFLVISGTSAASNKREKVQRLIELGANLDANRDDEYTAGTTPVMLAVAAGQFEIALDLLKAGADFTTYHTMKNSRLIHIVASQSRGRSSLSQKRKREFDALVSWLEERGESLDEANNDIDRWRTWIPGLNYRKNMDAEIAARKAREAKEQAEREREQGEGGAQAEENSDAGARKQNEDKPQPADN